MENIIEKVCGIRRTRQGEIQKKKSLVRNYSRTLLNVKNARTNIRSILHYDPNSWLFIERKYTRLLRNTYNIKCKSKYPIFLIF